MAFRICVKDFAGNLDKVVDAPLFMTYEEAVRELKHRGAADSGEDEEGNKTGNDVVHWPFTVRTNAEAKPLVLAGRFVAWDRLFVPIALSGMARRKVKSGRVREKEAA